MMVDSSKVETETRSIDLRQNRAFSKPSKKEQRELSGWPRLASGASESSGVFFIRFFLFFCSTTRRDGISKKSQGERRRRSYSAKTRQGGSLCISRSCRTY